MKKFPFLFSILLLCALTFGEQFITRYAGDPNTFYITSDITANLALSSQGSIYCTNAQIPISAGVSSNWKHSALSGISLSTVDSDPGFFSGQASNDHVLTFISPDTYGSYIENPRANSLNWNSFTGAAGNVPIYDEALTYDRAYDCNNDQRKCNAQVAAVCKAPLSLVEYNAQGNAISTTALIDYIGNGNGGINLAGHNQIASGAAPATRYFKLMLDKTCGTIVKNPQFYNVYEQGHHSAVYSAAQPLTITVQYPYTCNLPASNLQVTSPVAPSAQVTATFTLTNTPAQNSQPKTIRISSITLAQGSPFTNIAIVSPHLPAEIASGANAQIRITTNAPANAGDYPLNIVLNYATTDSDCSNSIVSCSPGVQLSAHVIVQQNQQYSCTLAPASATITNNSAYGFTASCTNAQGAPGCPILDWTTNAGSMSNAHTPAQRTPSSTLTVTIPQGDFVNASGTNGDGTHFSCAAALTPETLSCALSPALVQIAQDGTYRFSAACTNSQDEPYSCPLLTWASNAGSMSPQQHNTSSVLTVTNERGTHADATGSFNGIAFSCQSRLTAAPHTLRCELSPLSSHITRGSNYPFSASCFDMRNDDRPVNCPILNWASDAGGMSPEQTPEQRQAQPLPNSTLQVTSIYGTYVLAQGTSEGSDFSCNATLSPEPLTCELSPANTNIQQGGIYTFNMSCSNSTGAQVSCPLAAWDSPATGRMVPQLSNNSSVLNVTNVNGAYVRARRPAPQNFSCNSTLTNVEAHWLLNLVGGISTNKINPAKGEDFTITATVRNPGGDVAYSFANTLNVTGGFADSRTFDIPSLARFDTSTQQFQFTCPQDKPTILNFVFKADSANNVNETNERDNAASISILCGPVLTCMDYV